MKSQEYRNDIQTLKQSALFDRAYYASKYGAPGIISLPVGVVLMAAFLVMMKNSQKNA